VPAGGCTAEPSARVYAESYQAAAVVVVAARVVEPPQTPGGTSCLGLRLMPARVALTRPLGGRPVLDVNSGQPLFIRPVPVRA